MIKLLTLVCTYPLEVVMKRLITQTGRKDKVYNGLIDAFKKIFREDGIKGFYKGFYLHVSVSVGISLYFLVMEVLDRINQSKEENIIENENNE